jgi:hypothetical protein
MLINLGDVIDGALVNAIALAGRKLSMAVGGLRGRRRADDASVARWFETYSLTGTPLDLPGLSEDLAQRLAVVLGGDESQAALQELLAARLTDAPETDASAARQVLTLTLISAEADAAPVAPDLVPAGSSYGINLVPMDAALNRSWSTVPRDGAQVCGRS